MPFKRFFKANVMHMKYLECFQKCYHSIKRTAFFLVNLCAFMQNYHFARVVKGTIAHLGTPSESALLSVLVHFIIMYQTPLF